MSDPTPEQLPADHEPGGTPADPTEPAEAPTEPSEPTEGTEGDEEAEDKPGRRLGQQEDAPGERVGHEHAPGQHKDDEPDAG